ncbi:MAG: hypothetical protein B7Y08_27180 [Rhodospirillales bacterium 24-66-33]|nr:MAG: hypothetical protein B7Y57_24885 [Rhodospirillales bacterium 35-66-84]OYZ91140.1 MAG: hypothetical protein B7Y08_27180 [Rhodospirillales bacterium 24-66-33]OZB22636.1 MAG: hypothetical protein B7X63_22225 [Rhodospirillales bacterium 39-66-50]
MSVNDVVTKLLKLLIIKSGPIDPRSAWQTNRISHQLQCVAQALIEYFRLLQVERFSIVQYVTMGTVLQHKKCAAWMYQTTLAPG